MTRSAIRCTLSLCEPTSGASRDVLTDLFTALYYINWFLLLEVGILIVSDTGTGTGPGASAGAMVPVPVLLTHPDRNTQNERRATQSNTRQRTRGEGPPPKVDECAPG